MYSFVSDSIPKFKQMNISELEIEWRAFSGIEHGRRKVVAKPVTSTPGPAWSCLIEARAEIGTRYFGRSRRLMIDWSQSFIA